MFSIGQVKTKLPLVFQVGKYAIVGGGAAVVHYCVVLLLVQWFAWYPLEANIVAYLCGLQVSYTGHRLWTFKAYDTSIKATWLKFFMVSTGSFLLNEGLYFLFLHFTNISYQVSLFLVLLIVPPLSFVVSKLWAFK